MGAIIKSRVQHFVEGEKSSAFFLGLEKQKQNKAFIKELKDSKGNTIIQPDGIISRIQDFFQQLYTNHTI